MQTKSGQHDDVQNDIGEQSPGTHQRGASDDVIMVSSSRAGFRKCRDDRLG
jgi:hypothetical protein